MKRRLTVTLDNFWPCFAGPKFIGMNGKMCHPRGHNFSGELIGRLNTIIERRKQRCYLLALFIDPPPKPVHFATNDPPIGNKMIEPFSR